MKIHASILCVISGWLLLAFGSSAFAADGDKTPATQSSDAARRQFDGAVALHKGGAFDLAVDEWEKFLQKFPDDPLAAQAQFFAGVCYLSLKDKQFDKAREAFEKVVARSTRRTSIWAWRIIIWPKPAGPICVRRRPRPSAS